MRRGIVILGLLAGVALAGCSSGLEEENAELKARISALEQENAMLKSENERLSSLVNDLHSTVQDLNNIIGKTLPRGKGTATMEPESADAQK